jgi:biopolymer transport protein ExbB
VKWRPAEAEAADDFREARPRDRARRLLETGPTMAAGRRRNSTLARRMAACVVIGTVVASMPAALAQASRAWAGSDVGAREPLRIAEVPPSRTDAGTVGDAAIPTGNLLAMLRDGGILMVPLVGCSFALAVFGIERAVSLRTARVVPRPFVDRFIGRLQERGLERGEALDACEENGSPAARVFAAAVRRWGRPAVEIEQAAMDACERELNHLRRYRRIFNGVATVGPLLGLLGTVFGLIRSFNDVAAAGAMGRPDLLARGFGEALITTAMGLLVAIPAMVLHWTFTSRVDRLAMRLDEACQQVIDEISQDALADSRRRAA